jgi:hypothetical protein
VNNFKNWLTERNLFYAVLAVNLAMLCTVKYYPTMDGPSHLYNANLIKHLLIGDSPVVNRFFELNRALPPNWTSSFILAGFRFIFPAWVAEKALLFFYLVGISVSFRLLIRQLNPANAGLSIIIFPFAYSFLFHLGFYNYSLSFVFLFLSLYYWLKSYKQQSFLKYLCMFALISLTYLSAILTFFFLGFCLGMLAIAFAAKEYFEGDKVKPILQKLIRHLLLLFLISAPALVSAVFFLKTTSFFSTPEQFSAGELTKWLNDVRCLIVYDYKGDEMITEQFLHISIAILAISFFVRFYSKGAFLYISKFGWGDLFVIPMLITVILFYTVPNGEGAGMMSDRFCLLAYMFFIIWVSSQSLPKRVTYIFMILTIGFHFVLLFSRCNGTIKNLNKDAEIICNASKCIKENSVVLTVNMSNHWIEPNFDNYFGVDKPMVVLHNYEASVGWFPVRWNKKRMPRVRLGDSDSICGINWSSNRKNSQIQNIDYVCLYGQTNRINDSVWTNLRQQLRQYFFVKYSSPERYVIVYKRK